MPKRFCLEKKERGAVELRHDYRIEGLAFRLRPVDDGDADFIFRLRSERGEFFQKGAQNEREQLRWQREYYSRPNDYYFIIERKNGEPVGIIAAYDVDPVNKEAEMGRWIIAAGSAAATESSWLIYRFIFDELRLLRAYTSTVTVNKSVVSFHESCGMPQVRIKKGYYNVDGRYVDAAVHEMSADLWKSASVKLRYLAGRVAERI